MGKQYLDSAGLGVYTSEFKQYIAEIIKNLKISDIGGLQEALDSKLDVPPTIYGVSIDLTNSNPETSVTYTDSAVGMTAGSTKWDDTEIFKNIKPCMFKDGSVVGYLNPNDFWQYEDGRDIDMESFAGGSLGDLMIEIPKMGYKIAKSGNTLTVQVTRAKNVEGFSYLAHTRQVEGDRDNLYVGAYLGCNKSSRLRSCVGNPSSGNLENLRTYAQANGSGYGILSFYPLTLIQCLYLIRYKNLNSQSAVGMGVVNGTASWSLGGTRTGGMYCGESAGTNQMKFLGLEDLWGNCYQYIDGIKTSVSTYVPGPGIYTVNALAATDNFADSASYKDLGSIGSSSWSGYFDNVAGNNATGLIPYKGSTAQLKGTASTYFCDNVSLYENSTAYYGGWYRSGDGAGVFALSFGMPSGETCARLMYL